MSKKIIISFIVIALLAGGVYYWLSLGKKTPTSTGTPSIPNISFNPLNRQTPSQGTQPTQTTSSDNNQSGNIATPNTPAPILRQITTTPVGGFMASTTASSTIVRYVDRGIGHVFEASNIVDTAQISNTTIPKVYESYWNKNLTATILRTMTDEAGTITNFYGELRPIKNNSTSTNDFVPFETRGKFLSPSISSIAVSPKGDQIATFNIENGRGIGYISGFDESKKTEIFNLPITQVTIDWPEQNTIVLTTKPSGYSSGYLYFFDIKKKVMTKVLGGITGLIAKVSPDAKEVLYSIGKSNGVSTEIYNIKNNSTQEAIIQTPADKCVWSKVNVGQVYCAVPTQYDPGLYPDDWYKGTITFIDQIWNLDTTTGQVHLLANPLNLSSALIDAVNLTLDPKENFLYFTNKRDLTLWSLDLTRAGQ